MRSPRSQRGGDAGTLGDHPERVEQLRRALYGPPEPFRCGHGRSGIEDRVLIVDGGAHHDPDAPEDLVLTAVGLTNGGLAEWLYDIIDQTDSWRVAVTCTEAAHRLTEGR